MNKAINWNNSSYKVQAFPLEKEIELPTSKSYANRLLILAAIHPNPIKLINLPLSHDVQTLVNCLKKIGLNIFHHHNTLTIENSFPRCENENKDKEAILLESGDGGTTNRFLMAFLARGKKVYHLKPTGRIRTRPHDALISTLKNLGVKLCKGEGRDFWYRIQGPLSCPHEKKIEIEARQSTQLASALALALADTSWEIHPHKIKASAPYWDLTKKLISDFKNKVLSFQTPWIIPPDWSGASYPLALALLKGSVCLKNIKAPDPLQADSQFLSLIEKMGGHVLWTEEGLKLSCANFLKPIDCPISPFPDLTPTLAFVCAHANGKSILRNLECLRLKESDRVEEILRLLKCFQVRHFFQEKDHTLIIHGPTPKKSYQKYAPPEDHRIIMTAYLFMRSHSGGELSKVEHVSKSFPHFFETLSP